MFRPSHRPWFAGLGLAALAAVAALAVASPAVQAQQTIDPAQKDAIEQIVREYIRAHPEVVVEALDAYQAKKDEDERKAQATSLTSQADQIFRSPTSPVIGNPKGDVTLVEFFDYNCGYCKRSQPDLEKLLKQDTGLRVVLKEFPILGPASVTAARASLAAQKQDKYLDFHTKLMGFKGPLTDEVVYTVAGQVGLDLDKLKRDMNDPSVVSELRDNMDLAQKLGVQGTPAFVINDQIIPGAVGFDALKSQIDKDRAG
ncbi:protein-disulfide isomerase [Inquilinus ginsengisoli]|uniref:Protein-disulfide isomerase n=1 Tax=Inquilinus ginsengisoli TaxID=363840 RepID=A0ABU1JJK8_9PROT|nr:DsbA family protein [Inquilinus ginsengisoli]MDR6288507.1 protein-disulfide isomerase [Inquilinus ginsengisoli]